MIRSVHRSGEFRGKESQIALLHTWGKLPWEKLILVGIGRARELTPSKLIRAAAAATRKAAKAGCSKVCIPLPLETVPGLNLSTQVESVVKGALIGLYRFEQFKTDSSDAPTMDVSEIALCMPKNQWTQARAALETGQRIAEAANYARQISNLPGNLVDPQTLANEAMKLGREWKLKVTIWNRARLEKEKFGGILAVGSGSQKEPRLIQIEYTPRAALAASHRNRPVVLVGKAITFDSGGISIKPSAKMDEMKFDKCGGVTVLGTMRAIAALRLPVPVVGLIASAENMLSSTAYRPGDIITTYSGKTVEVLNTDAEGRIVLGDALAYARRFKPQAIVDLATLTGACVVALGPFAAGLFGNNETLIERLRGAGDDTGERVWPLPLWDEYADLIKSPVADIKNTGGREGGAITAAAFLQNFVGKTPWAHLDIAGTAWITEEKPYLAQGGTGFGVRLLVELVRNWKPL